MYGGEISLKLTLLPELNNTIHPEASRFTVRAVRCSQGSSLHHSRAGSVHILNRGWDLSCLASSVEEGLCLGISLGDGLDSGVRRALLNVVTPAGAFLTLDSA